MTTSTLGERVALLEQEMVQLRQQIQVSAGVPWWEQISGVFADTPAFDEAVELGCRYRAAQRPATDAETDVSA